MLTVVSVVGLLMIASSVYTITCYIVCITGITGLVARKYCKCWKVLCQQAALASSSLCLMSKYDYGSTCWHCYWRNANTCWQCYCVMLTKGDAGARLHCLQWTVLVGLGMSETDLTVCLLCWSGGITPLYPACSQVTRCKITVISEDAWSFVHE